MTVRLARVLVILLKELKDTLRDRKSLQNVLIYALVGPLTIAATTTFLVHAMARDAETVLEVPVLGAEFAPRLIEALADRNIRAVPGPKDPRASVVEEKADVVLVIEPQYGEHLAAMQPAEVTIVADDARQSAAGRVGRVRGALRAYSHILGAERLLLRGVSPRVGSPLSIIEDDVAPPAARGAMLFTMIPICLVMAFIMGAAYSAIDFMAGERERGSLEPLLSTAVTDAEVVLGKGGALAIISTGAALFTSLGCALSVALVPSAEQIGMRFDLPIAGALLFVLWMLPLAPLTASTLLWISARAKSVRDANTQVMTLGLLPMLSGMPLVLGGAPAWFVVIPFAGQQQLILELLRGSPPSLSTQLAAATISLLSGVVVTVAFIRAQGRARERKAA